MATQTTVVPLADGWPGTVQTLEKMAELIRAARFNPEVRAEAARICREAGVKGHDFDGEIKALFEHCRDDIVYRNDPVGVELLQDAQRAKQYGIGDCDDKTIALCSYLGCLGHTTQLVPFADGDTAGHVFCSVINKAGEWIPLDPTWEGATVGWEADYGRTWSYPIFEDAQEGIGMHYGVEQTQGNRGLGEIDPFSFDVGPGFTSGPTFLPTPTPVFNPNYDPYEGLDVNASGGLVVNTNPNNPLNAPQQQPTYNPAPQQSQSIAPLVAADIAAGLKAITSIFGNPQTVQAQNPQAPYYPTYNNSVNPALNPGVTANLNSQGLGLNVNSTLLWVGGFVVALVLLPKIIGSARGK